MHCFGWQNSERGPYAAGFLFEGEIVPIEAIAHTAAVVSFVFVPLY